VVVFNPMFKKPGIESRFFCIMGNASREGGAAKTLERCGRGARPAWVASYAGPVGLFQRCEGLFRGGRACRLVKTPTENNTQPCCPLFAADKL
jgi:hypothetical protein